MTTTGTEIFKVWSGSGSNNSTKQLNYHFQFLIIYIHHHHLKNTTNKMMSLTLNSSASLSPALLPQQAKLDKANTFMRGYQPNSSPRSLTSLAKDSSTDGSCITSFIFDPTQKPIFKEALKEPVAFMGGIFAGFLRLDLSDDPLREWVSKTVETAGITLEELGIHLEEPSQEIVIE